MDKQFFIFIARSGGGKGTQAEKLKEYLESKGVDKVLHITTGAGFRSFGEQDNYVANLSKELNSKGGIQPEFLPIWIWTSIFVDTLKGGETIILDGAPRKVDEATVLHSAISFFGYVKPVVIYLETLETFSRALLASRKRADDLREEDIAKRMSWFETDVLPVLEKYNNDPRYTVLHINGNQSIEDVHKEIVEKIEAIH